MVDLVRSGGLSGTGVPLLLQLPSTVLLPSRSSSSTSLAHSLPYFPVVCQERPSSSTLSFFSCCCSFPFLSEFCSFHQFVFCLFFLFFRLFRSSSFFYRCDADPTGGCRGIPIALLSQYGVMPVLRLAAAAIPVLLHAAHAGGRVLRLRRPLSHPETFRLFRSPEPEP